MSALTIDGWLTAARRTLAESSDAPAIDARRLAEHVLGLSTTHLIIDAHRALTADERAALARALARRRCGEPLALIVGHIGFGELELDIGPGVLVPRPETELLVETTLAALDPEAACRVADLGTGSGAIALSLAHARARWHIVATDASQAALAQAKANAQRLDLALDFRLGHWFEPLTSEPPFDALVSNPPYIAPDDPHLAALSHEPRSALVAAMDGLADLQHLAAGAPAHLRPGGWLLVEHGYDQGPAVRDAMTRAGLIRVETLADLAGHDRVTRGQKPSGPL